jgi:F0F1-type ATP synthase membrane subunit b/b'
MTAPLAAAIAFAVFILLLWYLGAHRRLLALLDDRTRAVKHELTEAETRKRSSKPDTNGPKRWRVRPRFRWKSL